MRLVLLLLLAVLALALWIRFAPVDPARWHARPGRPAEEGVTPEEGGARALVRVDLPPGAALERVDRVALEAPRTRRIAGGPETGMTTYETRSALWGFPDYTTVAAEPAGEGTRLVFHARIRFGRSDLGVNARRLADWTARLADGLP